MKINILGDWVDIAIGNATGSEPPSTMVSRMALMKLWRVTMRSSRVLSSFFVTSHLTFAVEPTCGSISLGSTGPNVQHTEQRSWQKTTTIFIGGRTTTPTRRSRCGSGPPLEYAAEKLRHSLEATHVLLTHLRKAVSGESLLFSARYAFHSQLTGYLALNNLLALANDNNLSQRLESYTRDQFREWLDRIDQKGSVTG